MTLTLGGAAMETRSGRDLAWREMEIWVAAPPIDKVGISTILKKIQECVCGFVTNREGQ